MEIHLYISYFKAQKTNKFLDDTEDEMIYALFIPKSTLWSLKCLCARIIANEQLNVEFSKIILTSTLKQFIVLHDGSVHELVHHLERVFI